MHEMKSFVILYTVFVVLGVFNQFVFCAARPDDEQTQSSIQQADGIGSRFDTDEPTPNPTLTESNGEELALKKCGVPNQTGLNKHGLEFLSTAQAKAGEYPWTVALLRKLNHSSRKQTLLYSGAGSLIHPSVVLTAANKHHKERIELVRAGEWDFGTTNEDNPYQDREITITRNINDADPDSMQLIFLSKPFVLAINVRTVCLPFPGTSIDSTDKRDCMTAAWGQQNCSGLKGLHSIQGRTEMIVEPKRSICETDWQQYLEDRSFKLKNNQFCTKRKHNIDDSCFCDHGAPLFCAMESSGDEPRYEQTGVSIATGGCTKELSGIFTSVPEERASIDQIFTEQGLETSYYTA